MFDGTVAAFGHTRALQIKVKRLLVFYGSALNVKLIFPSLIFGKLNIGQAIGQSRVANCELWHQKLFAFALANLIKPDETEEKVVFSSLRPKKNTMVLDREM